VLIHVKSKKKKKYANWALHWQTKLQKCFVVTYEDKKKEKEVTKKFFVETHKDKKEKEISYIRKLGPYSSYHACLR
jgi:hypothetical protein